jgi:hypothetical protein
MIGLLSVCKYSILQDPLVRMGKKRSNKEAQVEAGVGNHRRGVRVNYPKTITLRNYKQNFKN